MAQSLRSRYPSATSALSAFNNFFIAPSSAGRAIANHLAWAKMPLGYGASAPGAFIANHLAWSQNGPWRFVPAYFFLDK